jgi:hypothetical protein
MKNEYRRLVIASLVATMIMGVSNMHGNTLAIGPAHCDRPGWPTCYSVGYDAGQGRSGQCPHGHSFEFCRGWNDATKSANYNSGYNHGWQQGQDDWYGGEYTWLSGGNNFCPEGHTTNYCDGFHDGYAKLWSTMVFTYIQQHRPQFQYPISSQLQNYSTTQLPQNYTPPQTQPVQNYTPPQTQPVQPEQPQQCGLGKTIGSDGLCHYSVEGIIGACLNHFGTCTSLFHILGSLL